ncbi:MAG: hypothetical protein WEA99_06145 [Brumimicrobium sp.]
MAGLYILAGTLHFITPKSYVKIVPKYFPKRMLMVYLSGFFEVIFGIGLLFSETQSWAAIGIILLLVAVFPANIYMAQRMREKQNKYAWIAYARLPLQLVLIYWAYIYV